MLITQDNLREAIKRVFYQYIRSLPFLTYITQVIIDVAPGGGGGGTLDQTARDAADAAQSTADDAQTDATQALSNAAAAQSTANTALTNAATANSALSNKADLVGGLVPANQLPSYVDDVLEFANLAAFPGTGVTEKIYVAIDTNLTYRWSGSTYVNLDTSLALGETSNTAYRGDRGKTAYDHSQVTGNPHSTTAAQVGAYTTSQTDALLATKGGLPAVISVTSGTTLAIAGIETIVKGDTTSGAFTTSLPTAVGNTGYKFVFKRTNSGSNAWIIDGAGTETIDDGLTAVLNNQYESITIFSDGSNWSII